MNHPNICTIYEIDEVDGRAFIAMELLEGQTLRHVINGKPLEIEAVLDLGIQIADALDAAQETVLILQGVEAKRPSKLFVRSSKTGSSISNVRVGGHAVQIIEGEASL